MYVHAYTHAYTHIHAYTHTHTYIHIILYADLVSKFEDLRSNGDTIEAVGKTLLEWVSISIANANSLLSRFFLSPPLLLGTSFLSPVHVLLVRSLIDHFPPPFPPPPLPLCPPRVSAWPPILSTVLTWCLPSRPWRPKSRSQPSRTSYRYICTYL